MTAVARRRIGFSSVKAIESRPDLRQERGWKRARQGGMALRVRINGL